MRNGDLPSLPDRFIYRLDLCSHVTPRLLKSEPIHRWFWFPHSFSPQLLDEILKVYPQPSGAKILDPFVGAGTTVLRAKQLGYAAAGCDLSPLSIFVSRTKLQDYNADRVYMSFNLLNSMNKKNKIKGSELNNQLHLWESTPRLRRAFTFKEWQTLAFLSTLIQRIPSPESDLFLLAWLKTQQTLSRAAPDGGWFRWVDKPDQSSQILKCFTYESEALLDDLPNNGTLPTPEWKLYQIDSRDLSILDGKFDLILTSPPYPNRHDYSRVFHLALLGLGLSESEVSALRYRSLRSHVEAHRPTVAETFSEYSLSPILRQCLDEFPQYVDPRIPEMITGYFEDMELILNQSWHILNDGGICVLVIGNVRHAGVMVSVDEILVKVATTIGFSFESAMVARLRGNSAQQMARFGRKPARETILIFRK